MPYFFNPRLEQDGFYDRDGQIIALNEWDHQSSEQVVYHRAELPETSVSRRSWGEIKQHFKMKQCRGRAQGRSQSHLVNGA